MAITLEKLYSTAKKTYQMELLAGRAGLHNYVRWVHMIEDMQVPSFLHGSELVFTTGIGQQGTDWLLDFAKRLYESNGAGLVVNLGPYIDAVPPQVVVFCEQHGLPLFRVPWKVHLIDITYDFCHRIIANEENEISLANALRDLIFASRGLRDLQPTFERHGFLSAGVYCVAVFRLSCCGAPISGEQAAMLRFHAHRLLGRLGCKFSLFYQNGNLVVVTSGLQTDQVQMFAENLIQICADRKPSIQARAGIGKQTSGYEGIPEAYRQACAALKIAACRGKTYLHYDELGIYKLLISVKDFSVLRDLYREVLGPLADYDEKNGTEYMKILRDYLAHDSSVQVLSQLNGVHRNTVNYQIKRIRKILQCELTQEDKLKILLAFYIEDLLKE